MQCPEEKLLSTSKNKLSHFVTKLNADRFHTICTSKLRRLVFYSMVTMFSPTDRNKTETVCAAFSRQIISVETISPEPRWLN